MSTSHEQIDAKEVLKDVSPTPNIEGVETSASMKVEGGEIKNTFLIKKLIKKH